MAGGTNGLVSKLTGVVRRPPPRVTELVDWRQLIRVPAGSVREGLTVSYRRLLCYLSSNAPPADPLISSFARGVYGQLQQGRCFDTNRVVIGQELRGFDGGTAEGPAYAFTQPLQGLPSTPALVEVDLKDFWSYFYLGGDVTGEEGIGNGQPRDARVDPVAHPDQKWKFDHDEELLDTLGAHAARSRSMIGLCFHVGNPFNSSEDAVGRTVRHPDDPNGVTRPMTAADLLQLADPNSDAGTRWRIALDRVVDIVEQIRSRAVDPQGSTHPIAFLFRPLHESNQDFFWWGLWGQPAFQSLWQATFDYLTGTRGVHDMLWVFSVTGRIGKPPLDDFTAHYPGDKLVDIVGMDLYSDTLEDVDGWYEALSQTGKPVALTEYGPGSKAPGSGANQPNSAVRDAIHTRYPSLVLATCWYSDHAGNQWQIADKANPTDLLNDPWAVTAV